MSDPHEVLGSFATTLVTVGPSPRANVVVLHGYAMRPEDLMPFARSMGVAARFYFPEGPLEAEPEGRAWWPIDQERRSRALAAGARDLFEEHPDGAGPARVHLGELVATLAARHPSDPLVLIGFSQGGMLACDLVLRGETRVAECVAGLALLSSSRIAADAWEPLAARLRGMPILVSHGQADHDLAFRAGESLRDFCIRAGAVVTWVPFPGGHEIPLVVWRRVRRFLSEISSGAERSGP